MSRIKKIFTNLQQNQQKAFIPFITAGDGGLDLTLETMHLYAKNGANIIELGVPFSDPMADGEVIAASHQRCVALGVNLEAIFNLVFEFRKTNQSVGIVLMGYLNPVEIYGYEKFAKNCQKFGVDGVLIVDNPPEEAQTLKAYLDSCEVDLIFLIAPTTTDERIKHLSNLISGFVYFVSLKGITGSGAIDTNLVAENLIRIKKYINLPVCVGFGIKDEKTASLVAKNADGVIIGSAFVGIGAKYLGDNGKILANIDELSQKIVGVLK